ncbi:hypothetical protein [Chitinimonas sp. BJB300]|uniref:hypothetical protein n=1 Tax=Chitinimonas sp. BJB300 TaxID=1559339 RepID=UPI00130408AB|nr:hypothetical protein [Chitinimonas sp. BJB300]
MTLMTATIGLLYQDSTTRLCNSYLTDEQVTTGTGLIILATALVVVWCVPLLGAKSTR